MSDIVISVEQISKRYRLGAFGIGSLREDVNRWFAQLSNKESRDNNLHGLKTSKNSLESSELLALDDVSFQVQQGDILGIIGRNGAGKSTLLKLLSQITAPSSGKIKIQGRVGSLLEVGTGFHPELTGRENIYLNGAILGMSRNETESKFDRIVEFSEIERFIDTPVKRYSSGMTVRLAFSVAAHLEPEILIVDEVLAVGDIEFQKKCIGKMEDVADRGRTVLFVSHNMNVIQNLCTRGMLLDKGRIEYDGTIEEAANIYLSGKQEFHEITANDFRGDLKKSIDLTGVRINQQENQANINIKPNEGIDITLNGRSYDDFSDAEIFVAIFSEGFRIATLFDQEQKTPLKRGSFQSSFSIPALTLNPGRYSIQIGAQSPRRKEWMISEHIASFIVTEIWGDQVQQRKRGPINIYNNSGYRRQD